MEVQETFGHDVRIIGVAGASNDPVAMTAFLESTGSGGLTHIPDLDGSLWERFGARHRMYLYINDDGTSRVGGYGNLPGGVEELIGR